MTATQALKVYTHGTRWFVPWLKCDVTVVGSSIGMELARFGRHRKLVLFVKLYRHDNGEHITLPHYTLPRGS